MADTLQPTCCPSTAATVCDGLPDNSFAPANSKGWDPGCAGVKEGILCQAQCSDGFIGAYLSRCTAAGWDKPSGKCIPSSSSSAAVSSQSLVTAQGALGAAPTCSNNMVNSSCYPEPSTCWGPPPGPNPPNANATYWPALYGTQDGREARADCKFGLVGGFVSVCISGSWSPVVGNCYKDPNKCWGAPKTKPVPKMNDWWVMGRHSRQLLLACAAACTCSS